jgi:hypothetical protein
MWPDFKPDTLHAALDVYSGKERRFGKTPEQIKGIVAEAFDPLDSVI